jgi:hypothetical protein
MNNYHIVTVATDSKFYFEYLKESCKKFGKELEILGYKQKWLGYNWKFNLMNDYLKKINPTDIVVFVDGYDVVCLRKLDNLVKKFFEIKKREKCKIIVGHDKVMFFSGEIFQNLHFGKCKDTFLNSGSYIGTASDLLEILNNMSKMNSDNKADDQVLMTKYCNLKNDEVYIDVKNEIFIVLSNPFNDVDQEFKLINNEIVYKDGNKPFFFHGPASTYLDELIKKIGIQHNDDDNIKNNILKNFFTKKIFDVTELVLYEQMENLIFIILIIIFFIIVIYKKNSK